MIADGLFRPSGAFHCLPNTDPKQLEQIFRSKVLAMLKAEGKMNDQVVEKLLAWHHSRFSGPIGNRIALDNKEGQRALAEYIMRNAFSEHKITYIEDTGKVLYRSAMAHGGNKKNFQIFTAEEFIAAITQPIPDKSFQMARTYGWYSNRSRGERNKACPELVEEAAPPGTQDQPAPESRQATVLDVSEYKLCRIPSKTWRELIKKIREVDPLTGPRCGHETKILSLINDPDVIERILRHLGWWKQQAVPSGRKTKAPEHGPVVIEDFDHALGVTGPDMKNPPSFTTRLRHWR